MVFIGLSARTKTLSKGWGFKKHWRSAHYYTGDIYQDDLQNVQRKEWEVQSEARTPYLQYVQAVSAEWPHLRPLADFMEVGTDPSRWRNFHGNDRNNAYTYPDTREDRESARSKRLKKTHVWQLKYLKDGTVKSVDNYTTPDQLGDALKASDTRSEGGELADAVVAFKLFVVEDLSREVIERLGHHFDIDPDFFRAHIFDYAWFNIRDPFWNPPSLHMDAIARDWCQIRFCRTRYFPSPTLFDEAQDAANKFNIGRKLYEDENKAFWDTDISPRLVRTRAPLKAGPIEHIKSWFTELDKSIRRNKLIDEEAPIELSERVTTTNNDSVEAKEEQLGEESIDGKVGLMRTRATFWKGKEGGCDVGILLLDPTIKEGFPLWRGYRNWNLKPSARGPGPYQSNSRVPGLTRNGNGSQGEGSFFEDFVYWARRTDVFIGRSPSPNSVHPSYIPLLVLLRLVCAEWLTLSEYIKTRLSQVDWEVTHPEEFLTQTQIDTILKKLHTWRRLVPLYREMLSETKSKVLSFNPTSLDSTSTTLLDPYKEEFQVVLRQMEEYEERIDRLTTVVTSAINILDSRRVERLTLLATLFVPLSLVGTLFSMTDDITQISTTFGYWAIASSILLATLLLWAWITGSQRRGG
ncbi:hypothetical protein F5X97DRAFT_295140 [Nemania serpens]|nr:hypothetical protein F5X97DRAFT_295140 [Nemania serpens]